MEEKNIEKIERQTFKKMAMVPNNIDANMISLERGGKVGKEKNPLE